jgi:uncharacterized protein (TIGR01777 family)
MNIAVTGATGFIGRHIVNHALQRGHEVFAYSRDPRRPIPGCTMRRFSLDAVPDFRDSQAVIHLAGESILGFWSKEKKRRIAESRIMGTRRVVEAINGMSTTPEVFICGSGVSFYADGGDHELSEQSPAGSSFLADVVTSWEDEARKAKRTRLVLLRTSPVLGKEGGMLRALLPLFRFGLGAELGAGRQWMPWIHIEDHARLALFALENLEVAGAMNAGRPLAGSKCGVCRHVGQDRGTPPFAADTRVPPSRSRRAITRPAGEQAGRARRGN